MNKKENRSIESLEKEHELLRRKHRTLASNCGKKNAVVDKLKEVFDGSCAIDRRGDFAEYIRQILEAAILEQKYLRKELVEVVDNMAPLGVKINKLRKELAGLSLTNKGE